MEPYGGAARRTSMRRLLVVLSGALLLAGCGTEVSPTVAGDPTPTESAATTPTETATAGPRHTGTGIKQPPPFVLQYAGHELQLHASTYCYGGGCVDGIDTNPPSVGSPDEVRVFVPVPEFELQAFFIDERPKCGGRNQPASVEDLGEGWYLLRPHGDAGRYRVNLFASGGGDMVADFLWETTTKGPYAEPRATMAVIADHDGEPDSYGLELNIQHLAKTPEDASATITVTASNGRSMTIEATEARGGCRAEGTVFFDGPDGPAKEASQLGDFPFEHRVVLTLDGTKYVATATFPDDEIKDEEPSVLLEFEPPLPGLG